VVPVEVKALLQILYKPQLKHLNSGHRALKLTLHRVICSLGNRDLSVYSLIPSHVMIVQCNEFKTEEEVVKVHYIEDSLHPRD